MKPIYKKLTYVLIVFLLPLTLSAQDRNVMSLQQCIDTALYKNRNVKQQELTKKSREIAYEQARMDLLPNLNASADQRFSFGRSLGENNNYENVIGVFANSSASIFSRITLFDGLRMKYNIDLRKTEMMSSDADLEKIKSDIALNVTVAFLQTLLYKENLQIQEDQLNLTKQKVEQQTLLVQAGKQPEGELFTLKAQQAKEELSLIQAQNNYKLSLLDLAQIIELDNFDNLDVIVPEELKSVEPALISAEEVYRSALQNRPEIKSAEYKMQANERNVDIAKSSFYPELSLDASVGTSYSKNLGKSADSFNDQIRDKLGTQVLLSLSIPIFNRFDTRNKVRSARIAVESSKLDIENTKLELRKTIQQAYQNALAAHARLAAARESEFSSKEAYRYAEQKYEAGKASVYELYQAKSNYTQVLSELTQSKYEYVLRVKVLELLK